MKEEGTREKGRANLSRESSSARLEHFRLPPSAFLLMAMALCTTSAVAQQYPARPVRVIVPSQAGGGADIVARAIAQKLTEAWGQPVVVDNRIGVVGAESAARATPDGYTIMFTRCVS
jgi:tripartite-type tricarboxylate transporter receptor subunit TctC